MDRKLETILDKLIFHAFKSNDTRLTALATKDTRSVEKNKTQKKKKGKKIHAEPLTNDAEEKAAALEILKKSGALSQEKGVVRLVNNFTGTLSVAKSGVAFVAMNARCEAIVPLNDRQGALHRDRVKVQLTGFNRGRFVARVVSIESPFSSEYFARIVGPAKTASQSASLMLAELVDLPDRPLVLLKGIYKKGDSHYILRSQESTTYLKEFSFSAANPDRKGYSRTQAFVFEISKREVRQDRTGDLERLRLRYMLPGEFESALVPLKKILAAEVKKEMKTGKRVKVKDRFVFTIDGEDAKDFDDAVSCQKTKKGFELDVHIADVSFFVKPGEPLFDEALRRGNSYYLAGSVIPMLPEILSNEFCSLKPKTDRLAFSVRMEFDSTGKMLDYKIFKSVIHIDKRFTYTQAEKDLQKKKSALNDARLLAERLIELREKAGRIDLNIAEEKAVYDKNGKFVALKKQERLFSHRLIEECMLSANQAIAHFALKNHIPILHRNHESMALEKLDKLNRYLAKYVGRLKIAGTEQKMIARVLENPQLKPNRDIFQILLLRSFMQASYSPEAKGHWGLAFEEYAHFTSPIRRIADLVTHLQLGAYLQKKKFLFSAADLDWNAREASRLERIAFEAERSDKKLLAVRAFSSRVGETFSAWLSSFNPDKIFVQLSDFPVEGEILATDVDKRGEIRVIDDFTVFVGKMQKSLTLGDKLKVTLHRADPLDMALQFKLE